MRRVSGIDLRSAGLGNYSGPDGARARPTASAAPSVVTGPMSQLIRLYGAWSGTPTTLDLPSSDTLLGSVGISAKAMYIGSGDAVSEQYIKRGLDFCNPPPDAQVIGFGYDYDVDWIPSPLGSWDVPAQAGAYYQLRLDLTYENPGPVECDYRLITRTATLASAPWTGVAPALAISTGKAYSHSGLVTGTYSLAGTGLTDADITMPGVAFSAGTWSFTPGAGIKIVRIKYKGITIAMAVGNCAI